MIEFHWITRLIGRMKLSKFESGFLTFLLVTLIISLLLLAQSVVSFFFRRFILLLCQSKINFHNKLYYIIYFSEIGFAFLGVLVLSISINSLSMSDMLDSWFVFPFICIFWILFVLRIFGTKTKVVTKSSSMTLNSEDDVEIPFSNEENNESSVMYHQNSSNNSFVNLILELKDFPKYLFTTIKEKILFFLFGLAILISLCSMFVFFTSKCCITGNPFEFSTSFTRKLGQGRICQPESICHTYFTVPEDLSSSIIVNFQIETQFAPKNTFVKYSTVSFDHLHEGKKKFSNNYHMSEIRDESRFQSWFDMKNLTSNTTYYVSVGFQNFLNHEIHSKQLFKIRTGNLEEKNINFIAGGDMEWSHNGINLAKLAAKTEPLFMFIGGDIAYANGVRNCYRRWDYWFSEWNKYMITPNGYSIPILSSIGNHEAGSFQRSIENVPFYLNYFPHSLNLNYNNRVLYHFHIFSKHFQFLSLDSYIVEPKTGTNQIAWMNQIFKTNKNKKTIVGYHSSLYPSQSDLSWNKELLINKWGPIFDLHNVSLALENHYHNYHRSFNIYKNEVHPSTRDYGTIYAGGGSFGVPPNPSEIKTKFIRILRSTNYFMNVKLIENELECSVFDPNGVLVDNFKK